MARNAVSKVVVMNQQRESRVPAKEQQRAAMSPQALKHNVDLTNGLAAGAVIAGGVLAISAAVLEAPFMMLMAVGLAAIGAGAAVQKLKFIQPFLRDEQRKR